MVHKNTKPAEFQQSTALTKCVSDLDDSVIRNICHTNLSVVHTVYTGKLCSQFAKPHFVNLQLCKPGRCARDTPDLQAISWAKKKENLRTSRKFKMSPMHSRLSTGNYTISYLGNSLQCLFKCLKIVNMYYYRSRILHELTPSPNKVWRNISAGIYHPLQLFSVLGRK